MRSRVGKIGMHGSLDFCPEGEKARSGYGKGDAEEVEEGGNNMFPPPRFTRKNFR